MANEQWVGVLSSHTVHSTQIHLGRWVRMGVWGGERVGLGHFSYFKRGWVNVVEEG